MELDQIFNPVGFSENQWSGPLSSFFRVKCFSKHLAPRLTAIEEAKGPLVWSENPKIKLGNNFFKLFKRNKLTSCGRVGYWDTQSIKITGFFNSTDDFTDQPKVINPASETLSAVFGDKGKHARAAISTNSLPLGAAVEIDAIFEVD